jgi:flagellar biogenesis protein FliO
MTHTRQSLRAALVLLAATVFWLSSSTLFSATLLAGENPAAAVISDSSGKSPANELGSEEHTIESKSVRVPRPADQRATLFPGVGSSSPSNPSPSSTGWWLGSAGIALVLAVSGAICIGARRFWPQDTSEALRVVGRVALSPRHSIFLVRAGGRVLLIGAGTQGAPTLLGELDEDAQNEFAITPRRGFPRWAQDGSARYVSGPRTALDPDERLGEEA